MSDIAVAESGTRLQNFLDRAGLRGFPWKTATILYTISWGWLFIVRDSYWSDDWTEFKYFQLGFYDQEAQGFAPWNLVIKVFFDQTGPVPLRVLTFLMFFAAALAVFGTSGEVPLLAKSQRQFLALLFLLLPFNTSRVAIMVFKYTVSYFLFFMAWYYLVKGKKIGASLPLFFLSFLMHSLLVFYLLPILHFCYANLSSIRQNFLRKCLQLGSLVLLPFIYWILRSLYWPERIRYHDVSVSSIAPTVKFVFIFALFVGMVYIVSLRTNIVVRHWIWLTLFGLLAIFLGLYPYVVFGYFEFNYGLILKYLVTALGRSDWYSRHQTLQPIGVAILGVCLIGLLPRRLIKIRRALMVNLVALCVAVNMFFGFEFIVDYSKQKEIIQSLKTNLSEDNGKFYVFVDEVSHLNARGRIYRDRDWRGLIWIATTPTHTKNSTIGSDCLSLGEKTLVLIRGPETHWEALKNWVSDGDMRFEVTVDDTPGACKPEMVTSEKVSGAIPILFYFTGAKG
jgi:hypothetical protein